MPIDYTKRPSSPAPSEPPSEPPGPPAAAPGVSLSKVTLTKAAPRVSLTKHGGQGGVMRVNLNWDAKAPAKGMFRRTTELDLDLGCLFELADGTKGVVQALGGSFQAKLARTGEVLISLDGDDRSGAVAGGENMSIDLRDVSKIRRILIFALIYEGAANWAAANGLLTIHPVGAAPIEIHLDDPKEGARICAVALLDCSGGEITVQREVRYLNGSQRALDEAYGWGMKWTAGRK